ncbi:MAG: hypothetical protein HUU38_16205 [Anaerolineales bacterium]|nr:hypothetical protein [Anaerolineales bacterium]
MMGLIQDMGYVPNKMVQGLKNRQSLIGHLMVFNPNKLFAKISLAVNQAALGFLCLGHDQPSRPV